MPRYTLSGRTPGQGRRFQHEFADYAEAASWFLAYRDLAHRFDEPLEMTLRDDAGEVRLATSAEQGNLIPA